jgi:hypothetical protein
MICALRSSAVCLLRNLNHVSNLTHKIGLDLRNCLAYTMCSLGLYQSRGMNIHPFIHDRYRNLHCGSTCTNFVPNAKGLFSRSLIDGRVLFTAGVEFGGSGVCIGICAEILFHGGSTDGLETEHVC